MIPDRETIKQRLVARGKWFRQMNITDGREQRFSHAGELYRARRGEDRLDKLPPPPPGTYDFDDMMEYDEWVNLFLI